MISVIDFSLSVASRKDMEAMSVIADRYLEYLLNHDAMYPLPKKMTIVMDLDAANMDCPLDLEKLKQWSESDSDHYIEFLHDITEIRQNLNRDTGQLDKTFVPRCAVTRPPSFDPDSLVLKHYYFKIDHANDHRWPASQPIPDSFNGEAFFCYEIGSKAEGDAEFSWYFLSEDDHRRVYEFSENEDAGDYPRSAISEFYDVPELHVQVSDCPYHDDNDTMQDPARRQDLQSHNLALSQQAAQAKQAVQVAKAPDAAIAEHKISADLGATEPGGGH